MSTAITLTPSTAVVPSRELTMTGSLDEITALLRSAHTAGAQVAMTNLTPTVDGRLRVTIQLGYPEPTPAVVLSRPYPPPSTRHQRDALVLMNTRPRTNALRTASRTRHRRTITLIVIAATVLMALVAAAGYAVSQLVALDLHQGAATLAGFTALALLATALLGGTRTHRRHCPGAWHR